MNLPHFRIKGLVSAEPLQSIPEQALVLERVSPYDNVIDAITRDGYEGICLTFECGQRASSASYSLRGRVRKQGKRLTVVQRGKRVYTYKDTTSSEIKKATRPSRKNEA